MELRPLRFGGITTENNLLMAPLAGYTNYPFRRQVYRAGAGLAYTEMVSAKGLHYGSENTKALLLTGEDEKIKAVQLFGDDPAVLREACESEALAPFSVVDINMGCPMPKIVDNGEGSALLARPALAEKIVSECKKSGKVITVKMRIGLTAESVVGAEFAKALENGGADMLCVHGRTKDKIYAGEPDFAAIAAVKRAVGIPVVGNGGVFSVADADEMVERTGVDGVMLARAGMYDPQIFCDFTGRKRVDKKTLILRQLSEMQGLFDERFITVYMRKMAVFYLKGEKGIARRREELFACQSVQALCEKVEEIFSYRS